MIKFEKAAIFHIVAMKLSQADHSKPQRHKVMTCPGMHVVTSHTGKHDRWRDLEKISV